MTSFSQQLHLLDSVTTVRNQFRQTFNRLDNLQSKLEMQIEQHNDSYPSSTTHPLKLNQRMTKLGIKLQKLQKRCTEMQNRKSELLPKFFVQVSEQAIDIHHFRCESGLKNNGIPDNIMSDFADEILRNDCIISQTNENNSKISNNMNVNCNSNSLRQQQSPSSDLTAIDIAMQVKAEDDNLMMVSNNNNTYINYNQQPMQSQSMNCPQISSFNSSSYVDDSRCGISMQDFSDLSSLIRQRVTYSQLCDTYEIIRKCHFRQLKKGRFGGRSISSSAIMKQPLLTIKDLAMKGAKLTGQTGTAVINCLRSLKLITSTKHGIYLYTL